MKFCLQIVVVLLGASESALSETGSNAGDLDKKPKKNRCHTCKKKVGLTGKLLCLSKCVQLF